MMATPLNNPLPARRTKSDIYVAGAQNDRDKSDETNKIHFILCVWQNYTDKHVRQELLAKNTT